MPPARRSSIVAFVFLVALACLPAGASAAGTAPASVKLYASPTGQGSTCSRPQPCSLTGAQQAVRALDPGSRNHVTVELADGTYNLSQPLKFIAADSGSPGDPVVWQAAPGAHPVLSGARPVTGWSPVTGSAGLWQASVPAGSATRQLYVNGTEAPIAQATPAQLGFAGGWTGSSTGYDISSDPAAVQFFGSLTPAQISQVEFVYPGGNGAWTQSSCRLRSYSDGQLTMDQPCWQNVTARLAFVDGSGGLPSMGTSTMPSVIENVQSLLHPGQWFLDSSSNTLYFDSPQSMSSLDVELPHLESLLQGAGSLADPVHDLTFSGLQFSYATWNEPSSNAGFADVQSNLTMTLPGGNQGMCTFSTPNGTCPWGALTQPAVNVGFSGSNNITLSGDRFIDLGGAALGFEYGDSGDTVTGSLFDHIASTAILLGCTYDPTPTVPDDAQGIIQHCSLDPSVAANDSIGTDEILQHTTVSDNVIEHVGTDYPSACGITLLFSQHTTITHNDIFDVPYTGITAGVIQGHVDDQTHSQESVNVNGFNTISDNLIHDYMQVLNDGGAMYIEGHQAQYVKNADGTVNEQATLAKGMQAVGNVAYNKVGSSPGMYDDAGSEYINWQNNVLFRLNGNSSQGGCDSTGPFGLEGNFGSGGFESYFCLPQGVSIQTFASDNTAIPDSPGPGDLPASAIDGAGVPAKTAKDLIPFPQVYYESAESSSTAAAPNAVLIAGEGLSQSTPISFSGQRSPLVQVLSPGIVIATVPAGANSSNLTVGNPPAAPTITTPSPGAVKVSGSNLTVSGTGSSGATITVAVDGAQFSGCQATVSGGSWSCTIGTLSSGEHSLTATAQNAVGQTATSTPALIDVGGVPLALQRLNDTDPSFVYDSDWSYSAGRGFGDFGDDLHYTQTNGASLTYTFLGTGIKIFGEINGDQGEVGFSIDGGPQQTVDTSTTGPRQTDRIVFQQQSLTPGQHTITITKLSGTFTTFDGVEVDFAGGPEPAVQRLNDTDPSCAYDSGWFYAADRGFGDFDNDVHAAEANGSTVTCTFLGTGVKAFGEINNDQGDLGVSIDGGPQQVVDTSTTGPRQSDQVIFQQQGLTPGQHTITITKLSGTFSTFDGIEVDFAGGAPPPSG